MNEAMAALRPPVVRHPFPPRDPSRPKGLNALGIFAHHPDLTRGFYAFNGHILFGSTIDPRVRELLVLRVAHLRRSAYEWAQHALLADDAGLTVDEVARVRLGPDADGWDPLDAALVRAVDELVADARIADATWSVLAAELDERQLLDVVFTVGAYEMLAMAFNSFGIELDADLRDRG